jgi:hypothetical protein
MANESAARRMFTTSPDIGIYRKRPLSTSGGAVLGRQLSLRTQRNDDVPQYWRHTGG